ncbi:MAG: translation initiation factor IF-2 [Candidatus Paceibacterota bacterium]|jgi:translation initiation factor IF-2
MKKKQAEKLSPRPPIVVILGHVDHGKTTLLDYIRKTNVAAKEAGGITQSIGAYEIEHTGKKITFVDTPGHEAFNKMRERGANVADLAILVVAAEEGLKPQTKESIDILNKTKTPFVVAINKIDKPAANIDKVINDLLEAGVLLEKYGGHIPWQGISAKTGEGVNELLDLILLVGEMESLTYSFDVQAKGIIIESKLDPKRGATAAIVLKDGTLKIGDQIATQTAFGKIKTLENFLGKRVDEILPSSPVLILGFETMPQIGEEFWAGGINIVEIKTPPLEAPPERIAVQEEGLKENYINLIIKADSAGSLEALRSIIEAIPLKDQKMKFLEASVGDITDGDIGLAQASKAVIIGFKVKVQKAAQEFARIHNVKIVTSDIIYEIVKILEEGSIAKMPPTILGELEVLAVFNQKTKKQIIGGKVISGVIKANSRLKVKRGDGDLGTGKILNLQQQKQDAKEIKADNECGMLFESDTKINVGDHLVHESQN